jgi:hypothetical protein
MGWNREMQPRRHRDAERDAEKTKFFFDLQF